MFSANFQESDFIKLIVELTKPYYFPPNIDSNLEKDITNRDKQIDEYWERIVKTREKLQLKSEDYQYLIPSSRNDWQKNQCYDLYEYLQDTNNLFAKFQQHFAKILWCLFAYVSPSESDEIILRYLSGPVDEQEKERPHFLFRAYHANSNTNKFESMSEMFLDKLAKTAYYQRKKAHSHEDIDFIYILKSQRKRTDFEIDNKLMYVPSGEMDTCILQWLLLVLNISDITKPFTVDLSEVQKQLLDNKVDLGSTTEPKNIYEWLEDWGLIKYYRYKDENHTFILTPRGKSMLYWFATYLKSVECGEDGSLAPKVLDTPQEPHYWRVLAKKGIYDKEIYLQENICQSTKQEIISKIYNKDYPTEYAQQFDNMLKLMVNWVNSGSETWRDFSGRCRFSTLIHYVLRFSEKERSNLELYSQPSGLLALPVWWDNVQDKQGITKRLPVGVFMSIIQENDENDRSYFKDFDKFYFKDDEGKPKNRFTEKIKAIKAVILPIARIENIEVYQSGIKRLETQHQIYEQKINLIRSHKHTIKNFQFRNAMGQFLNTPTEEWRKVIESILLVRDITTDFIYSLGGNEPADRSLIFRKGINSYTAILTLIEVC